MHAGWVASVNYIVRLRHVFFFYCKTYVPCHLLDKSVWTNRSNQEMFFLDSFSDFALDVVGFLAILGEGSIQANAHIISLSYMSYVPRLLPAPQALLPAQRSTTLRVRPASVTGVSSGNMISGVNHVADVLM